MICWPRKIKRRLEPRPGVCPAPFATFSANTQSLPPLSEPRLHIEFMNANSCECEMINANLLNSRSGLSSNGCSVMHFDKCVVTSATFMSRDWLKLKHLHTLLRRLRLEREKYIPLYSKSIPSRGICSRHRKCRGFPANRFPVHNFPRSTTRLTAESAERRRWGE